MQITGSVTEWWYTVCMNVYLRKSMAYCGHQATLDELAMKYPKKADELKDLGISPVFILFVSIILEVNVQIGLRVTCMHPRI